MSDVPSQAARKQEEADPSPCVPFPLFASFASFFSVLFLNNFRFMEELQT